MDTKAILALENANERDIILFREGLFWRAYQLSAYLFVTHIRPLKITTRYVKVAKAKLVYIGFPDRTAEATLQEVREKGWQVEQQEKRARIITGLPVDRAAFQQWFEALAPPVEEQPASPSLFGPEKLIEKIRSYPIMEKTPLETQQALSIHPLTPASGGKRLLMVAVGFFWCINPSPKQGRSHINQQINSYRSVHLPRWRGPGGGQTAFSSIQSPIIIDTSAILFSTSQSENLRTVNPTLARSLSFF